MAIDQPIKLCECGCGQPAPLSDRNHKRKGRVKGQPMRFIHNHHLPKRGDLWERIRARCAMDGSCLIWQGAQSRAGYGQIQIRALAKQALYVHRVVYEYFNGPIPAGLEIDHVKARGCHSRACCNPAHLEAVPPSVNNARSDSIAVRNAAKTHCPSGHALTGNNLTNRSRPGRECRICAVAHQKAWRAKRRAQ